MNNNNWFVKQLWMHFLFCFIKYLTLKTEHLLHVGHYSQTHILRITLLFLSALGDVERQRLRIYPTIQDIASSRKTHVGNFDTALYCRYCIPRAKRRCVPTGIKLDWEYIIAIHKCIYSLITLVNLTYSWIMKQQF